jgi:Arc/MetJ family transcription regulator
MLYSYPNATDGHAARESVRVDDDIWTDAVACERHVHTAKDNTNDALLSVVRRELVAYLRRSGGMQLDAHEPYAVLVRRSVYDSDAHGL